MKLDRFEIKNFRSIKDMAINIEERNGKKCIILVGKNEAGKSNILKAISAVFGQYEVSIKDQNKNATDDKYYIRAIFKLEENDFNVLETGLFEEYNIKDTNIFQNNLDIRNFIKESFNEILLTIKIDDNEEPRLTYWIYKTLDKKYKILRSVYYEQNSKQITVSSKENSIGNELSINDLKNIIFTNIENYIINIEELYNNMIFWEYNDQYLLPSSLNIEDFKNDPDICIPLKNIFYLNNITDIEQDIENASKKDKGLHGFLERISKEATKEFRKIWPDLDNIEFIIRKDGEEFDIRIKEKEFYSNEDRSDGFKRFIAILLMLSIESRTQEADNRLILFDEPDAFLYPTSARFLKEELLKISENSIVIYSTHSPFMIDNECIERHLVIERKDDISEIVLQGKSPFQEDELLKRAIGSHIFESIQSKNIIFEGYMDYKIFKMFCNTNDFKNCGIVYMGGIKDVDMITTMMMLTGKKFLIISDSDETSKNKKKDFEERFPEFKTNWIEYDIAGTEFKTIEDFYSDKYVLNNLESEKFDIKEYDNSKACMVNINKIIKDKNKIKEFKNRLINNISKNDMKKDKYTIFMDIIKKILTNL